MNSRAVIVDDEVYNLLLVAKLLNDHFPEIDIVAKCNSVSSAISCIDKEKPDLAFLDIELPDGSGFDILEKVMKRNFKVVFITAHNHYAVKAFKFDAIDYILKPIEIDDFIKAVNRAIHANIKQDNYQNFFKNLKSPKPSRLEIFTTEGIVFENIQNISRIKADGRYSEIHMADGRTFFVSKGIGEYEEILDDTLFLRTHKSHLINLNFVSMFIPNQGGYIKMKDGAVIELARTKKECFLECMKKLRS